MIIRGDLKFRPPPNFNAPKAMLLAGNFGNKPNSGDKFRSADPFQRTVPVQVLPIARDNAASA